MEIRGLGIVDVMSMFGIRSVRYQKRLEVIMELTLWEDNEDVNRTGLNYDTLPILDLEIPCIKLRITPGKNITVITEIIAMNHLLKHYGYDPAQAFHKRVRSSIAEKTKGKESGIKRAIEYFEGDVE